MAIQDDNNEVDTLIDTDSGGDASEQDGTAQDSGAGEQAAEQDNETAPSADAPQTPEEKIAALEQEVSELNDRYLRKIADFENFRKRMNKEKQDAIDFANQNLLLDLVSILDDFDRAIRAAETSSKTESDFTALCEGIGMIEKRLLSQLENKWGLKRFDSEGEPFDLLRHEAVMMEKSADVKESIVKDDFAKGYTLKERVIRAAKVKVLMPE